MGSADVELQKLQSQHAELEDAILSEAKRPLPDTAALTTLKRQKLKVKEEIERLSHA